MIKTQICNICGKKYVGADFRKTCSKKCGIKYRNEQKQRKLQREKEEGGRVCLHCGKKYPLKEFSNTNARSRYCKKCWNCYTIEQVRNKKQQFVSKYGGRCVRCGYNRYIGALEFHHTDPLKKEFNIRWFAYSDVRLQKELEKCILVCSNCHREIHHEKNQ